MPEQKICQECNDLLDLNKFKKTKKKDKIYFSKVCQRCHNKRLKFYRNEYYKKRRIDEPGYGKKYKEKYLTSEKGKAKIKEYSAINRETYIQTNKNWYKNNKKRKRQSTLEWIKNNPEKYAALVKKNNLTRRSDLLHSLSDRVRSSLRKSFNKLGAIKRQRTFEFLGFSNIELFNHLSKWLDKPCEVCGNKVINLNNSNIDHIIPVCIISSTDDIIKLNQLENLRLICEECNLYKISSDLKIKQEHHERLESMYSKNRKA